jgi:hypothetical protein
MFLGAKVGEGNRLPPAKLLASTGQAEQAKTVDPSEAIELLRLEKMQLISLLGSKLRKGGNTGKRRSQPAGRVFLSYARADKSIVSRLYDQLTASGFIPWMDVRDIQPGEDWRLAIQTAIRDCDFFVLCLSPNSVGRRGFLQREIKLALDRLLELLDDDIYFVPLRLQPCARPAQIGRYQTVDLFEPRGYDRLISALKEGVRRRKGG